MASFLRKRRIFDTFVPGAVLTDAMEESIIVDGATVDNWYRVVGTSGIHYASCSAADMWRAAPGPIVATGYFPYVFRVAGTYFMVVNATWGGDLYLYCSTNKTTWTICNGGNPVLHHSATPSAWSYNLYNPAVAVDAAGTWHLAVEGIANGGGSAYAIGYSSAVPTGTGAATAISWDANLTAATPIATYAGNPELKYVPERGALMMLYGSTNQPGDAWAVLAKTALLSSDLSSPASWRTSGLLIEQFQGYAVTDPHLVFTDDPRFNWRVQMAYNCGQNDGYRAFGSVTLTEFYDLITETAQRYMLWFTPRL